MQKYILLIFSLLIITFDSKAQGRKQIANFSQFQHYYNPSFTGFEGPVVKTLYRNQWTGFEDAPKTVLATAELNLQRIGGKKNGRHQVYDFNNSGNAVTRSIKHALGVSVLHDRFGPSRETQFLLGYGSGIRLSEKLSMRWGTALTYQSQRLDGNSLTLEQENDPKYIHLLGQNNSTGKVDLNLGLSLSSSKFYLGYAMQDITEGKFITTGDDSWEQFYTQKHIVQSGYRTYFTDHLGLTLNGIYQYDVVQKSTLEGQIKTVYQDRFWIGGGYRTDAAYHVSAGIRLNQLSINYAYETPISNSNYLTQPTNDISLSYNLKRRNDANKNNQLSVW